MASSVESLEEEEEEEGDDEEEEGAMTMGEMIGMIEKEGGDECRMADRIGGMLEDQLMIYVNFLEGRRNDPAAAAWMREATSEILRVARRRTAKKTAATTRPERPSKETMDMERRLEMAEVERLAVLKAASNWCHEKAQKEVQDQADADLKTWISLKPQREADSRKRRYRFILASLFLAGLGLIGAGAGGNSPFLLAAGLLFSSSAALLLFVTEKQAKVESQQQPQAPQEEAIERRAEDLLTKWQNEQKRRIASENFQNNPITQKPSATNKRRRPSAARLTRKLNAKRRMDKLANAPSCPTSYNARVAPAPSSFEPFEDEESNPFSGRPPPEEVFSSSDIEEGTSSAPSRRRRRRRESCLGTEKKDEAE